VRLRKRGGIKEVRKGWKNGEGVGKQWRVGYQRAQMERSGKTYKESGTVREGKKGKLLWNGKNRKWEVTKGKREE
jgi:hypothetical protein